MKAILASAALVSLLASASYAGNLIKPNVEPMIQTVEDDNDGISLLLPLVALAALVALASSSSASDTAL